MNNHLGQFEINEKTGIVRLKRALDRESESFYNLTVQAMDHGVPPLSSTVLLSVTVLDVNDNPPEFTNKIMYATVSESVPVGSEIATVHATSEDIGINAEISYSVVGGDEQGFFEISSVSGKVFKSFYNLFYQQNLDCWYIFSRLQLTDTLQLKTVPNFWLAVPKVRNSFYLYSAH